MVDLDGRLVGVIRHAAMVEAEKERASVGIQTMVGVSPDERATSSVGFAVRKRLPWLQINLVTAFVAAAVVGLFEHTIAQFTAIAAAAIPIVLTVLGQDPAQSSSIVLTTITDVTGFFSFLGDRDADGGADIARPSGGDFGRELISGRSSSCRQGPFRAQCVHRT